LPWQTPCQLGRDSFRCGGSGRCAVDAAPDRGSRPLGEPSQRIFSRLSAQVAEFGGKTAPACTRSGRVGCGLGRHPAQPQPREGGPLRQPDRAPRKLAQWSEARPKSLPVQRQEGHDHCAKSRGLLAQWSAGRRLKTSEGALCSTSRRPPTAALRDRHRSNPASLIRTFRGEPFFGERRLVAALQRNTKKYIAFAAAPAIFFAARFLKFFRDWLYSPACDRVLCTAEQREVRTSAKSR
jgi:hypothetical protein